MATIISKNAQETYLYGKSLSTSLKRGDIIALFGTLGAGKTTLIQGIAEGLNSKNQVNSPTFTYLNIYEADLPIYHFDLYRIKSLNHFLEMGFDEYFYRDGCSLIEWAENIEPLLPKKAIRIVISYKSKKAREIWVQ